MAIGVSDKNDHVVKEYLQNIEQTDEVAFHRVEPRCLQTYAC